ESIDWEQLFKQEEIEFGLKKQAQSMKQAFIAEGKGTPAGFCDDASCVGQSLIRQSVGDQVQLTVHHISAPGHQFLTGKAGTRFFIQDTTFTQFTSNPRVFDSLNSTRIQGLANLAEQPGSPFAHLQGQGIA